MSNSGSGRSDNLLPSAPAILHGVQAVNPALLPVLRDALARAFPKTRALGVLVASTGRRAAEVRRMRWADLLSDGTLWQYRPGRVLPLSPLAREVLAVLPKAGPYVLPGSWWTEIDRPWSDDAAEKAWERFTWTLPNALRGLTLTALRASREAWLTMEAEPQAPPPPQAAPRIPFAIRQQPLDLSALLDRQRETPGQEAKGMTLSELCELYLQSHMADRPTYTYVRRMLYKNFSPWFARPIGSIQKVEILAWQAAHADRKAAVNRALGQLRAVFNWALRLDLVDCPNPTEHIRRYRAASRMRFVQPEEMPRLLEVLASAPPTPRAFLMVLLCTAARCGEARRMQWTDVNLTQRRWTKPTTKNGRPHIVPLPFQVVHLLDALPRVNRWVFPGLAGAPISSATVRKWWVLARSSAGLPDVTLHDLRRTCASWLAIQGVNLSTIQHVLNHVSLTPTAIYARLNLNAVDTALQGMANQMQFPAGPGVQEREGA